MAKELGKKSRRVHRKNPVNLFIIMVLVRILNLAVKLVPFRAGLKLGASIGTLAFLILRKERRRALDHLRIAFPDRDDAWLGRTARASFTNLGISLVEMLKITPERAEGMVDAPGMSEKVGPVLATGRGAVWVTCHLGNWELFAHYVAKRYSLTVVAAPIEPPSVNRFVVERRAARGVTTIVRGSPGAARELIRVFRENRLLGILMDQDTRVEGAFVDFFGKPAWTPTAAAQMALKFDVPVLFGYMLRGADGRHTVTVEGPMRMPRTGDHQADVVAGTALLTRMIEDAVRCHPEQWVWMHRRWKRKPAAATCPAGSPEQSA